MPSARAELLAEAVLNSRELLARYLAGFDDTNHTRQAHCLPNHAAWTLGHLALTMHRVADRLDGSRFPARDFIEGAVGDRTRFGIESVAFGSKPVDDPAIYPTFGRSASIFDNACERLAAGVRAAADDGLDADAPWGARGVRVPLRLLVIRMVFHNGTHTGQLADLRRALGFGPVLV